MHTGPVSIAAAGFLAVVGFVEGVEQVAPHPDLPPVNILSVEVRGSEVIYTRRVEADEVIRAPYFSDMVDVVTERSIAECERSGRADYGPDEPQRQIWRIDEFFGPSCTAALVPGRSYAAVATVSPIEGPPSVRRSEPFVWTGE